MKRTISTLALIGVLCLSACGLLPSTTSGPVIPGTAATASGGTAGGKMLSALLGTNVLMDDPTVLALEAEQACNVGAAQEYRLSVAACSGTLAGTIPGFVVPANGAAIIDAACGVLGYTGANNQLSVPATIAVGNCEAVLNLTAPAAAAVAPAAVLPTVPAAAAK